MIRNIFNTIVVCLILEEVSLSKINGPIRHIENCGVSGSKSGLIVHGEDFPRGTYPWIVALMHTGFESPKYFCAGSLISKNFVISGKILGQVQSEI